MKCHTELDVGYGRVGFSERFVWSLSTLYAFIKFTFQNALQSPCVDKHTPHTNTHTYTYTHPPHLLHRIVLFSLRSNIICGKIGKIYRYWLILLAVRWETQLIYSCSGKSLLISSIHTHGRVPTFNIDIGWTLLHLFWIRTLHARCLWHVLWIWILAQRCLRIVFWIGSLLLDICGTEFERCVGPVTLPLEIRADCATYVIRFSNMDVRRIVFDTSSQSKWCCTTPIRTPVVVFQ